MPTNTPEVEVDEEWFDTLERRVSFNPVERATFEAARDAWARYVAIRERLESEGLTVQGRWGPDANPLLGPEARARTALLAALKQLRLGLPEEMR
jgi:hypothetical protein